MVCPSLSEFSTVDCDPHSQRLWHSQMTPSLWQKVKTKIMVSGPITSWEIDRETVSDFIFGGSKITADGDCTHEIKTLTPWKESYDQPR